VKAGLAVGWKNGVELWNYECNRKVGRKAYERKSVKCWKLAPGGGEIQIQIMTVLNVLTMVKMPTRNST
jgi:hypothetical protein